MSNTNLAGPQSPLCYRSQGGDGIPESFSAGIRATMDIVDMPDRRAYLLVRMMLQNNGRLSQTKRATFSELKDEEISAIEEAVASLNRHQSS